MATTTNYSWTTPDDTALVKDGALAIRTLGSSVDTTVKALNPETTLGDISYRSSTANTNTRLPLGTAGQVLTVNSGATAPEWTTPASGGMTLLSTTTLTGASVTLSSIPGTYKNLQLIIRQYRPATDAVELMIRINSDSNANRHSVATAYGTGSNATFNSTFSQIAPAADNGTSNGLVIVDFYDYADTSTWKIFDSLAITNNETTTTNMNRSRYHGQYNQTAAITSLDILPFSGNFTSGTALLYGVK